MIFLYEISNIHAEEETLKLGCHDLLLGNPCLLSTTTRRCFFLLLLPQPNHPLSPLHILIFQILGNVSNCVAGVSGDVSLAMVPNDNSSRTLADGKALTALL